MGLLRFGGTRFPRRWGSTLEAIDLGGEDEIAFGEARDFVGPDGDHHFSPGQENVRMVSLGFREFPDFIGKGEGLLEIGELELPFEVMFFKHVPTRGKVLAKEVKLLS